MKKNKTKLFIFIVLTLILVLAIFLAIFFYNRNKEKSNEPTENPTTSETKTAVKPEVKKVPNTVFTSPIYMYHHIQDVSDQNDELLYGLSLSVASFQEEMKYLKNNNYKTLTLSEMMDTPLTKSVVLTFDDGYIDVYKNAYPIMQKSGFHGVVFIITGLVGTPGYMSWDDLKVLKNAGWEMGSHTLSHPDLETLDFNSATQQIVESKTIIEKNITGTKVKFFCYPSGKYNDETIKILKTAGYTGATTTQYGTENSTYNLYELQRIRLNGGATLNNFTAPL